ncbi:uracil-DNA glycosylase [Parasedimentitalea psychrophila]|uniref:Type-4 uracil-DNA glycosylase n=1 Tax=Parasedimentitalea psychrophila TaxID=2997337 RepID=A0A9Y2L1L1_9RHOB|nr:uracil-DNA glycosylase [Parasedimentitalea psychrophila]WIY26290.1 uracil-DNA glycosylase [Parasedimentitalea psychrophila]
MESALDYHSARALLQWQVELGVTESIGDAPVNRYALQATPPKAKAEQAPAVLKPKEVDPVEQAQKAARAATGLASLRAALEGFEHCALKKGARNLVFSDGQAGARVMIIGEAPGREEDRAGTPFAGPSLGLLDKMLAAIDLSRDKNVYLTCALPWRPPQNQELQPADIAMMVPFLQRHVELAEPEFLLLMGNAACQAVLGKRGINRLRGEWQQVWGKAVLPMLPPDRLLGQPQGKRQAWADLLSLKARLVAVT